MYDVFKPSRETDHFADFFQRIGFSVNGNAGKGGLRKNKLYFHQIVIVW